MAVRKIFIVSLHRSATQSTDLFLRNLGLRTCHWPSTVDGIDYESQCVGIETEARRIFELLRPVFETHDAVSDSPMPIIYEELSAAYPDAKFIAVRRDPTDWLHSVRRHTRFRELEIYERVQYWRYLQSRPTRLDDVEDAALIEMHRIHHEGLSAHFSGRNNFLALDLADPQIGRKLSAFLGTPEREFPRVDYKFNTKEATHRFHVVDIPRTAASANYDHRNATEKLARLCALLRQRGHYVLLYGEPDSGIQCDEHVTPAGTGRVFEGCDRPAHGNEDRRTEGCLRNLFVTTIVAAIQQHKRKGDFLLSVAGSDHQIVVEAQRDLLFCELVIGKCDELFAPFRIFESYAVLHAYMGANAVEKASDEVFYSVVIPDHFDITDYELENEKDDYFLFLGERRHDRGIQIAVQTVEAIGGRLIVIGSGSHDAVVTRTNRPISEYVEHFEAVDASTRKKLIAKARAVILPSPVIESFCGVQVEAMLSGTPVISSDWGAFVEYNIHGVTGYRCRTLEQFVWAAKNIGKLQPAKCREWAAANFSVERIGEMYEEFFFSVKNVSSGAGWFQDNPSRDELDWLTRRWPGSH